MSFGERCYAELLVIFPSSFRREFAPDLVMAFRDLVRERGRCRAWLRCLTDLGVSAPRLRMEAAMQSVPINPPLVSFAALLAVGAVASLIGGAPIGALALSLLSVTALAYRQRHRRSGSPAGTPHRRRDWIIAASAGIAFVATAASWLHQVSDGGAIGNTTVLIHNAIGLTSFALAAAFTIRALLAGNAPSQPRQPSTILRP